MLSALRVLIIAIFHAYEGVVRTIFGVLWSLKRLSITEYVLLDLKCCCRYRDRNISFQPWEMRVWVCFMVGKEHRILLCALLKTSILVIVESNMNMRHISLEKVGCRE
jgi:hypothetical protein